jgi:branched-chain amino acid transport system substrate-binding protein
MRSLGALGILSTAWPLIRDPHVVNPGRLQMKQLATTIAAALALAAITALDALAAEVPGVTDAEIKVGTFGPLTGPVYIYGKLTMNGVEVYFNKLNNEKGGIHGRKLVLVREDDLCKPEGAIAAVKKLVHDHKVFAIIGGGCSNPTLAARPDIEKAGIPFHVFAAVADGIVDPPIPNIYTTQLTASIESKAQIQWALDRGAKKIAIIAQHDAWGRSRYEPMLEDFKRRGLQVVADEEVTVDQNDGTAQALRLKSSGADAVMLLGYPKAAAVVIRDSIKIAYKPIWVGQTAIQDLPALQGLIGIDGALTNFVSITTIPGHPDNPQYAEWRKLLKDTFPNDELSVFNLMGIAAAEVFAKVADAAGKDLTREKFLAAYSTIDNFKSSVYPGPITCKADHKCNQSPAFVKLENNNVVFAGTVALK